MVCSTASSCAQPTPATTTTNTTTPCTPRPAPRPSSRWPPTRCPARPPPAPLDPPRPSVQVVVPLTTLTGGDDRPARLLTGGRMTAGTIRGLVERDGADITAIVTDQRDAVVGVGPPRPRRAWLARTAHASPPPALRHPWLPHAFDRSRPRDALDRRRSDGPRERVTAVRPTPHGRGRRPAPGRSSPTRPARRACCTPGAAGRPRPDPRRPAHRSPPGRPMMTPAEQANHACHWRRPNGGHAHHRNRTACCPSESAVPDDQPATAGWSCCSRTQRGTRARRRRLQRTVTGRRQAATGDPRRRRQPSRSPR